MRLSFGDMTFPHTPQPHTCGTALMLKQVQQKFNDQPVGPFVFGKQRVPGQPLA